MRENLNKKTTSEKERACPAVNTKTEDAANAVIAVDAGTDRKPVDTGKDQKPADTGDEQRSVNVDTDQRSVDTDTDQKISDAVEEEKIALDEAAKVENCAGHRHKKRTPEEQKALLTRLKRVEGQIRGIERMVENDAYCPDILIQVSAATSALNSFNKELLQCHVRGCVAPDIRDGKDETIDELCRILQKLMK